MVEHIQTYISYYLVSNGSSKKKLSWKSAVLQKDEIKSPTQKESIFVRNKILEIWGEMARNFTFNLTYSLIYRLLPKYFVENLACKIQIPCY